MAASPKHVATGAGKSANDLYVESKENAATADNASLSEEEGSVLFRCEKVISKGFVAFFEVGQALMEIRQKRLYRDRFRTFEEYCRHRWDISRFHAHRQIQAAEVMGHLLPMGNIPLPANERQIRPLLGLPLKMLRKTWVKVVEISKEGKITEAVVRAAVQNVSAGKNHKQITRSDHWQELVRPLLLTAVKVARAGDREAVRSSLNKALLLLDVGSHGYSQEEP